jgi:hypothetical protein
MQIEAAPKAPNFIVAGAIKAGTTTLYQYLKQHPQIFVPETKELRFFAYDTTDQWCLENGQAFPIKSFDKYLDEFSTVKDEIAIGEVSPNYLASAIAPQAIHSIYPDMKMIFSLRNPVDSAYSAYQMDARAGRETRPIESALATTERRVERYRYYNYLKEWYALFENEQILVIAFDDLVREPEATMVEIYAFLGVDTQYELSTQHVATNRGGMPESKLSKLFFRSTNRIRKTQLARKYKAYIPSFAFEFYQNLRNSSLKKNPMPDGIRSQLRDYYRDDVAALEKLTNLKVDKWGIV